MEIARFIISSKEAGTRLSDYLEDNLWSFIPSRKGIKKAIKRKLVLVNQIHFNTGYRLKEGDVISYLQQTVTTNPIQLNVEVVFEDEYLAVVVKPSGIPTSGNQARTLKNALAFNLLPSTVTNALLQPLPVHRLDALTSGLVLVAKTTTSSVHLSRQFQQRVIKKEYSAVVSGVFPDHLLQINTSLDGKQALTDLTVVKRVSSLKSEQLTLLRLFPQTGRTHQLRKHLSNIGCPILGDQLYAGGGKVLKGKGLFLCAVGLEFEHPISKEKMKICIDPPAKFQKRLQYEAEWYERKME